MLEDEERVGQGDGPELIGRRRGTDDGVVRGLALDGQTKSLQRQEAKLSELLHKECIPGPDLR